MPKFKVGDRVERNGSLVPPYMRSGTVIRVIPDKDGSKWFNEYEVDFGEQLIGNFYEAQLKLVRHY